MNIDETTIAEAVATGKPVDLPDGRALRVRIETDHDTEVGDYECYGRVAWVETDRDTGQAKSRPEGFDGRALKLHAYGGDTFWWQPPYDMGMPDDDLPRSRAQVIELVSFGFHGVIVELLDGHDAYGEPIVRDVASLWGVDDIADEYVRSVVADLVEELA